MIQEICTSRAGDTHIEAVTLAREGLAKTEADEKWLIVLTDGTVFYRDGQELTEKESIRQLTEEFNASVTQVNAMYLGIGKEAQSGFEVEGSYQFVERKATNSAQVLANLTELGNLIFGRDVLPTVSETVSFDVAMKKLIVFVQGEAIDNVKLGNLVPTSTNKLKYSTHGAKNYADRMLVDPTLQGTIRLSKELSGKIDREIFDVMRRNIFGGDAHSHTEFSPARTRSDWLCADQGELELYLKDELCREDISSRLFCEMLWAMKRTGGRDAYEKWQKDMLALLISGANDPVGDAGKGVQRVEATARKAGMKSVQMKLYPGARHDLLHEEVSGSAEAARNLIAEWLVEHNI